MKRTLIVIIFVFASIVVNSQIVFNRIIEDTIAHITSSVVAVDTGYFLMSGSGNNLGVRTFAIRYIDLEGNVIWKKIYGNNENQFWEGFSNSLIIDQNRFYSSGAIINDDNYYHGIYLYHFDSVMDSISCAIINQDDVWKKSFNLARFTNGDFFITGQIYDSELDDAFLYLVKTDSFGNFIWERSYGQRNESGRQIIITSDSCVLMGGHTYSFPISVTDQDWYLIKVDTAGNVIWEKGFGNGSIGDGGTTGIIETQDSNYIACGSYPVFEAAMNNFYDGCLRKVSKDGELMWTKYYRSYYRLSSSTTDRMECSASSLIYKNDNLYVLGNYRINHGASRGFLQRITDKGDICWNREYYAIDTTSTYQWLNSIKNTNDGGFIIAGYGNEYDRQGYNPPQQAWLIKTDSLGLDGLCNTEIPELNIDIDIPETVCKNDTIEVHVYIAGKSAPYTVEFSTGQVIDSIFYPPLFIPVEIGLSETSIEVGGIEYFSEVITEATLSNHEWGQCIAKPIEFYTPYNHGSYPIDITVTDAYGESKTITKIVNVNNCGDLVEQENICPVKLYPNPAKDKVYFEIPNELNVDQANIYNSAGQLVKISSVHKGLNVVDVSDLASGNYIIKITTDAEIFSLGFEKE